MTMREIKFRAWNDEQKYMHECVTVGCDRKDKWPLLAIMQDGFIDGIESPYKLMQYTGLKDKNGVEIYEGHILKCKCKKPGQLENGLYETVFKNSVVEWWQSHSNLGYRLRDGRGKTFMIKPSSLATMDVEVVGNIYEHPHLLEVS